MIKNLIITGLAVCGVALTVFAASPRFVTKSDPGVAASPAEVIFPSDPSSQLRIVSVNWQSDSNSAALSFSGGSTAYNIQQTNALTSSVTNLIGFTNGLSASAVLVLEHAGVCYSAVVSSWNASATFVTNSGVVTGGTNVVLASGGWGVATSIGDKVFLMDTPVTIPVGITTNAYNGFAVYAATLVGRPVRVVLTPALVTNRLNSVVAVYD